MLKERSYFYHPSQHWGGSVAIFGNFWQPLFLEILKIHVKVAKNCQKLPKVAKNSDSPLTLPQNFRYPCKAGKQNYN